MESKYEITYGKNLQVGDIIIHEEQRKLICSCKQGVGAGNEFGRYVWVKANVISEARELSGLKEDSITFWLFENLPVIKELILIEDNHG